MNVKELKNGVILYYLLIVINALYGIFFTPFLLENLGAGGFGAYKIIASFSASIAILDLGIDGTVLRYIAKYKAENDNKKLNNFYAMSLVQASVLSVVIVAVCLVVYFCLEPIYGKSLTPSEFVKIKQLFKVFTVLMAVNVFEKVLSGVISGCEQYTFANAVKLSRLMLKIVISYFLILKTKDSLSLVLVDLSILILIMVLQCIYIKFKLHIKLKLYRWDNFVFKEAMGYTILTFIQSIASQFNGNLDNMVIGSVIGATAVAVYSVGLQLYVMYDQFAFAFSNLMLPTVSKQIANGDDNTKLENTVIKIGRLQFMALGGALCAYALIGSEFITLWLGDGYKLAWLIGLILMVPATISLIQNVCLAILRAKNKMLFRTIAVSVMAIFNLLVTIFGVKYYGVLAACIGTAIGLIGANIIAMNIYYVKVMNINVIRIFKKILSRTWLCCVMASIALITLNALVPKFSWYTWFFKAGAFVAVYGLFLLLFGMNDREKEVLFRYSRRKK